MAQALYNKYGDPECESRAYWKEMLLICTFPGVKCRAKGISFSERIERGGKGALIRRPRHPGFRDVLD
jgi:hypothetical protein